MHFVLMDINNLVHRAKHVVTHYETFDECVGMVLTIVFNSLKKSNEQFGAQHCVACFDSYSWRKKVYPEWKADRKKDYDTMTPKKKEEEEVIKKVLTDVSEFLKNNTNVTVLERGGIEADDFIARWVQLHNDESFKHVIVSADGDFKQLVRDGVDLFDPIRNILYSMDGVFYQDGKRKGKNTPVVTKYGQEWKIKYNKKTGEVETLEPQWEIFKICIRGVKNNTKSAFPRVYETKMRKAFNDKGGLEWNNFINQHWGPEDARQSVRERYEFNRTLMDLNCLPKDIVIQIDEAVYEALGKERKRMVGAYFERFCGRYGLDRLSSRPQNIVSILSKPYDI